MRWVYASYSKVMPQESELLAAEKNVTFSGLNMHKWSFFLKVFTVCQHLRCTHLQGSINPAISILISVVISHCKDIKRTKTLKSFESQLNQIVETVINF